MRKTTQRSTTNKGSRERAETLPLISPELLPTRAMLKDTREKVRDAVGGLSNLPPASRLIRTWREAFRSAAVLCVACAEKEYGLILTVPHPDFPNAPHSPQTLAICIARLDEWFIAATAASDASGDAVASHVLSASDPNLTLLGEGGHAHQIAARFAWSVRYGASVGLFAGLETPFPDTLKAAHQRMLSANGCDGTDAAPCRIDDGDLMLVLAAPRNYFSSLGIFPIPTRAETDRLLANFETIEAKLWTGEHDNADGKANRLDRKMPTRWIANATRPGESREATPLITSNMLHKKRKNGQMTNCSQGPNGEWYHNLAEVCDHYPQYRHLIEAAAARI